ncbi:MAG: DUF3108 domain-containing protein [Burkholderiales bacterium]
MRAGRSTTQRLSLLALAVVALHVLLIGSVADRLGAINAPQAARTSSGFAVRTVEYKQFGSQVDASVVQAQPTHDATASLRDESRDLVDRSAPLAARTAPPRAMQVQRGNTAGLTQRPVTAEPGRMAALASPANARSARVEAQSPSLQATDTEPIDTGPASAIESASAQSALPIYPTRIPTAFAFAYRLTRGGAAGEVELRWQPEGDRYVASLEGRDGDNALLAWRSVGGFDAAGIAPQRFVDHRRGRGALAVNFQRDAGKVTFSGPQIEHALAPGMQDRLSWMLQLAAIAAADSLRAGTVGVSLIVVGVHGDAEVWNFEPVGSEALVLAEGAAPTLRLLRRPERAYDTRAEVWLDPSRHYLPLRVRLSNGGETLQLEWRGVAPSP